MMSFRRWFYLFPHRAYLVLRRFTGTLPKYFARHGMEVVAPSGADVEIRYLLARGRPYEQAEAGLSAVIKRPAPISSSSAAAWA